MRRNAGVSLLHQRWTQITALLIGVLLVIAAFVADQCGHVDKLMLRSSVRNVTLAAEGRRLFYPQDYIIGRWTDGAGKETFEQRKIADPRYPGTDKTIDQYTGEYNNAPVGRKFGIIVHVIGVMYMLVGLNTICDIYFCGALDEMVIRWGIQEDVAGATFMAAGGSAPELFTSIIAAVGVENDVGFSTIVGSAVFNVLAVIGCCGVAAAEPIKLSWWPLFRDCTYYIVSLCLLGLFAWGTNYSGDERGPDDQLCRTVDDPEDDKIKCGGGKIKLHEAIILFCMYICYCTMMAFNKRIQYFCEGLVNRFFGESTRKVVPIENGQQDDQQEHKPSENAADGSHTLYGGSGKCPSEDAHHIHERDLRRIHHKAHMPYPTDHAARSSVRGSMRTGGPANPRGSHESGIHRTEVQTTTVDVSMHKPQHTNQSSVGQEAKENGEEETSEVGGLQEANDGDQNGSNVSEGTDDIEALVTKPEELLDTVMWALCLPVYAPMYFLIPRPENWFLVTFGVSLCFIAFYTYLLLYCVMMFAAAILGGGSAVDVIMGFTVLAAGTSIPDLISSMAVAREGKGDMAVSSSIGSNIFDILVGLPLPWILKIGVIEMGINGDSDYGISINSPYIPFYVFLLLFMVACVIISILINKWWLNYSLGIMMSVLYFVFLLVVIPLELFQYI